MMPSQFGRSFSPAMVTCNGPANTYMPNTLASQAQFSAIYQVLLACVRACVRTCVRACLRACLRACVRACVYLVSSDVSSFARGGAQAETQRMQTQIADLTGALTQVCSREKHD
jgi:hypothetical protein